ncbi:MAG: CBS domain-containing protein [Ideonella sp.]|nr:CBS domain-containing protein [Ideonella sp.]
MNLAPSTSLIANLRAELQHWAPFALMAPEHVDRFTQAATQVYFAPDETVLAPSDGVVQQLLLVRRGAVSGRPHSGSAGVGFQCEAGDLFPLGAVLGARAVTSVYTAVGDTFCLQVPIAAVHALAQESAPFADFLNRRVQQFLAMSNRALQASVASQTLAEQSMATPLRDLLRGAPVGVAPSTPLRDALRLMHERRIGSVLVQDETSGAAIGMLTRHDIVDRVTLAERPLATPITEVMSSPVIVLGLDDTAQDAAIAMSRHAIRHLPVADAQGRVVGVLSERDLFALQSLSLRQVSSAIRAAADMPALRAASADIGRLTRRLLGQGVGARQLTELISHLNDLLTLRLVELVAPRHGVDLSQGCWLAFGSEGRSEQTIATDQDNGIVFASDDAARDRTAWLAFAREVNAELDACGYPLCKGNIMASNPECCLTAQEWLGRFGHWIDHGAPEDLLAASIYFDFRPLAGNAALAVPLREAVTRRAAAVPRFIKQMADNSLRNRAPLDWLGGIETKEVDGRELLDLKMNGTAIFVDVARLYALANGIAETHTRRRFEAIAPHLKAGPQESEGWSGAFEFLQSLRLQAQLRSTTQPNLVDPAALNDIDRRVLKECIRAMRRLQQRVELDFQR